MSKKAKDINFFFFLSEVAVYFVISWPGWMCAAVLSIKLQF